MNKNITGVIIACGVSILLAGSYIGSKYLQASLPPYAYTAARVGIATLFLLPFMAMGEFRLLTKARLLMFLGVGFFGFFLTNHLFTLALNYAPTTNVAIMNGTLPIMVLIASCFMLRRYPTLNEVAALACSFLGVMLIICKKDFSSLLALQKGEMLMLLSNVAGVANSLLLQSLGAHFSSLFMTALGSGIGMLFLLPLGLDSQLIAGLTSLNGFEWLVLIAVAVLCTALPFWGFSYSIASLGASVATFIIMGLVPIFVSILAYAFFGEPITWIQVLGGAFVGMALFFGVRNTIFMGSHKQFVSR